MLGKTQRNFDVLIVESFVLFHNPSIRNLCDLKIYIDVPESVMHDRRMNTTKVTEPYFQECIIPNARNYRKLIDQEKDVVIISGELPEKAIFDQVVSRITAIENA